MIPEEQLQGPDELVDRISAAVDFGTKLLLDGKWSEVEAYALNLNTDYPLAAAWLRISLAIEKAQRATAVSLLNTLAPDVAAEPRWAELRARIGLLDSIEDREALQAAVGNTALGTALRARCALALGDRTTGNSLLEHALHEKQAEAEAFWLAGLLAAENKNQKKALADWSKALELRPCFAACWYDRGRFRLSWGDPGGERDCIQGLTIKPWAGSIAITLAQYYAGQKSFLKALKVMDQTLIAKEDQPDVVAALIDVLRVQGEKERALHVSGMAIEKFPSHAGVWLSFGALLQQIGQRDKAIAAYQHIKQNKALSAAAANNMATMLLSEGDVDSAISEWEEALSSAPNNQIILCNLGHALLSRGDTELAYEKFQTVIAGHRNNADALRGMARCSLEEGNEKQALKFAERALEHGRNDVRSYLTLSKVLAFYGEFDKAIRVLQQGLSNVERQSVLHKAIVVALSQRHDFENALSTAKKALEFCPSEYDYYEMTAEVLIGLSRFDECEKILQQGKLIDLERGAPALVRFYLSRNRYDDALREASTLLEQKPDAIKHYGLLGEVLYRMEKYDEAREVLLRGRTIDPARVAINRQLAGQFMARELYDEALIIAQDFMKRASKEPQFRLLFEVQMRRQAIAEAYEIAEQFLSVEPNNTFAMISVAKSAERLKNYNRAVRVLKEGVVKTPANSLLQNAYISLLCRLEHYEEALEHAYKMLNSKKEKTPQIIELAVKTLVEANVLDDALKYLNQYIDELKLPRRLWAFKYLLLRRMDCTTDAENHLLSTIQRFSETDQSYKWVIGELIKYRDLTKASTLIQRWIHKRPFNWDARFAELLVAEIQKDILRIQKIADFMTEKWSMSPLICSRLANSYSEQWALVKAMKLSRQAVELRPDNLDYLNGLMLTLTKAGDFSEFDGLVGRMEKLLGDKRYHAYINWFFVINSHPEWPPRKIFEYQELWGKYAVTPNLPPEKQYKNTPSPNRRLRIGYVSPDFRRHAVSYFSEPLLIEHERQEFELYAFAHFEQDQKDVITDRFKTYFHHWIDISSLSDDEFIRKVRENQIDILVDLAGHTKGSRLRTMAQKPAPIQVSYALGAGQTTGLEQIDYFVAEKNHVPPWFEQYCSEKVVRQQWRGYPYMPDAGAGKVTELPFFKNGRITFGSCSRPIRIGKNILSVWAKLLNALPTAKLQLDHLPYHEAEMQQLIRERFVQCGGNPDQLVFANTRPYWDFYHKIDIMLDTFPAGSGTTATDSLWMGVPVVTVSSRPLMGLFATIQLKALGLEQYCVATNEDEYIERAVKLASDPELLAGIRMGLRQRFLNSSLVDYKGYAKDIARIYREMWTQWCNSRQSEVELSNLDSHVNP